MTDEKLIELDVGPLSAVDDPGALEFSPPGADFPDDYFVVRHGGMVSCFSNVCTHMQQPLNWAPNRFLNKSGEYIVCPAHGATYDSLSGECRGGPCNGRGLTSWSARVDKGRIIVRVPPAEK
ncbi:MAG TPA: Rieske 2Fe-2S domain-containing protein [Gammaproteobacteria bacterium]|nr:Rieske 2Fe-2S domain-containing protein [Gammaproteobacteria bacterium]